MNKPYVKEFRKEIINENGVDYEYTFDEVLNPITKETPHLHKYPSLRGKSLTKYRVLTNPFSGQYMGKIKTYGNNRKNTSKRKNKNSRNLFDFN